ncbi:MAG: hypothetical protein M1375_03880 [Candidatus Thermoplasmatota archaeon]|jgi:hypothetical protein|nr:hypothetical protein [Candidatus Thermoplasmatota archaeon]MCL5791093.1 hypothetical protein [Candidatus Thermoplasmatota archaeon]
MNDYAAALMVTAGIITFAFASIQDHRKRSVHFLIFMPFMIVVNVFLLLTSSNHVLLLLADILWAVLFLNPEKWTFPLPVALIFGTGVIIFYHSPDDAINWIVMGLFAFMGTGEKLFGIGDIKGMVSVALSLSAFYLTYGTYYIITIPENLFLVINLGITSSAALVWAMIYTSRTTGRMGYFVRFDGDVDKVKFREIQRNGSRLVSYRVPFMEFIMAAYILTVISWAVGIPL